MLKVESVKQQKTCCALLSRRAQISPSCRSKLCHVRSLAGKNVGQSQSNKSVLLLFLVCPEPPGPIIKPCWSCCLGMRSYSPHLVPYFQFPRSMLPPTALSNTAGKCTTGFARNYSHLPTPTVKPTMMHHVGQLCRWSCNWMYFLHWLITHDCIFNGWCVQVPFKFGASLV